MNHDTTPLGYLSNDELKRMYERESPSGRLLNLVLWEMAIRDLIFDNSLIKEVNENDRVDKE